MLFYLSVARDLVSLWDTPDARQRGALVGEVWINLELTPTQSDFIAIAKRAATVLNSTGEKV